MKTISVLVLFLFVLSVGVAGAAPPSQTGGETYAVQADDWLSKLADKFYGDVFAWPAIWEATNAKATEDDSFAVIEDPNVIEVGQKLWIPSQDEAQAILANRAMDDVPQDITATLQNVLDNWSETNDIIGVSLAVYGPEVGEVELASGLSNLDAGTAMAPSNQLYAGSVTKTFIAALILQLIEEGKLSFDDTLDQWYPDFPNAETITVRQMLNMTSGTFDYFRASPDNPILPQLMMDLDRVWNPEETIGFVADLEPTAEPGTMYDYSNTNYIFLGRIIEEVTGNDLEVELQTRILEPLAMDSTYLAGTQASAKNMAHGYARDAAFLFGSEEPIADSSGKLTAIKTIGWAAGGLVSNAGDLARFAQALFGGGLLSQEALTGMVTPGPLQGEEGQPYALGVEVQSTPVGEAVGHPGSVPGGFSSLMLYVPEHDIAVVVMSNDEQAEPLLAALVSEVLDAVLQN